MKGKIQEASTHIPFFKRFVSILPTFRNNVTLKRASERSETNYMAKIMLRTF